MERDIVDYQVALFCAYEGCFPSESLISNWNEATVWTVLLSDSTVVAIKQEDETNAVDHGLESHLNAAGRIGNHSFRDLRSASRARQRDFKNKSSACHSVACRKWRQSDQRLNNKRKKRELLEDGIWHSQERAKYCFGDENPMDVYLQWDIRQDQKSNEYFDYPHDVVRYEESYQKVDIVESEEPHTELGDYIWQCSRNDSECWELVDWDDKRKVVNGGMVNECYCRKYLGEIAPDEMQSCSLAQWTVREGTRLTMKEELEWGRGREAKHKDRDIDEESTCGSDWSWVDG